MNRAREPIFNVPAVVLAVAVALVLFHLGRGFLSDAADSSLLIDLAFVPAREISWFVPGIIDAIVRHGPPSLDQSAIDQYQFAVDYLQGSEPHPWTLLTYAFLHQGWLHLGLNLVVLSALGSPVARRFGSWRFLALLVGGAVAGALMHLIIYPTQVLPLIGASASVSACMGAAARFVFDPAARAGGRAPSLAAVLRNRTVIAFALGWFIANALSGLGANPGALANASIAWEAHIGGFLLGFLAFVLFDPRHSQGEESSSEDLPGHE